MTSSAAAYPAPLRLYLGAGEEAPLWAARGWTCNDLPENAARFSSIALSSPCFALPLEDNSAEEILAQGLLEHLTYHEAERALREWLRVLRPRGFATFDVPDVEEYLRQYLAMKLAPESVHGEGEGIHPGEPQDESACRGIDRWLRRALYGWQRYPGDEHRSGWTESLLRHYLEKNIRPPARFEIRRHALSFDEDVAVSRVRHLWTRFWK